VALTFVGLPFVVRTSSPSLSTIAGLETPSGGTVQFFGQDARSLSVRDRKIGLVFQHYALFRHMTVFENVAFAMCVLPRASRPPEGAVRAKVHDPLRLVQLDFLADRYPSELSGGQRQRVALSRTLAIQPHVLLSRRALRIARCAGAPGA